MVRIATHDAESVTRLVQFLVGSVNAERVWLDCGSGEVCVDDRGRSRPMRRCSPASSAGSLKLASVRPRYASTVVPTEWNGASDRDRAERLLFLPDTAHKQENLNSVEPRRKQNGGT
jgi:hypothetical protein